MINLNDCYNKALLGAAIPLNNICMVYPLKIKEVIGMGEDNYLAQLNLLTLTSMDLVETYKKKKVPVPDDIDVFDNLMESCERDNSFLLDLENAFFTFLREEVQILSDLKLISVGNGLEKRIIDKNIFYDLQDILRVQNRIPIFERPPENETAMEKKFRLRREEVARAKQKQKQKEKNGESASLHDLISSLCCLGIGVTLQNVGDLSVYSFHELLDRSQAKEEYETDMRMLLAGADSKKIKPSYWIKNLKKK